jgi:hypothetical protein
MMTEDFDLILDECIDRISRGGSLADCLSDYPAYSERLRPLLQSMYDIQKNYGSAPSADAKRAARRKLYAALGRRHRTTPVWSLFKPVSRPAIWATVAVLTLAVVGTLVVRSVLNPPVLSPSPDGNFVFLISDKPGDINDFENFDVTISEVKLQPAGSKEWLKLTPEIETVDLTQVQGEQSQEIWRGNVPAGQYSRLRIYVSETKGSLKSTGQTIDVKVPGNVAYMPIPFEVTNDAVTIYTFGITVVGVADEGKYALKLQVSESGAYQQPKASG